MRRVTGRLWLLILLGAAGCVYEGDNFSRYPGFKEFFALNPPSRELPDEPDRQLLRKYRPRFLLPANHQQPVDFYRDYIASGTLRDGKGAVISDEVTRKLLNSHKDDYYVVFEYRPRARRHAAVVFGRITRETLTFHPGEETVEKEFTFLSYHIVFPTSGLPAGIPAWQERLVGLIGDVNDWHQLDHYTAAFLVLEGDGHGKDGLVAIMLQQHNNVRTYIVGEGISLPPDGRVLIDVAVRSNELYVHHDGPLLRRAVAMPDPPGMYYLLTGEKKPRFAGHDLTDSVEEVRYDLAFLPPDDAFYTFKGYLGERRLVPGRTGPPGADYNTIPELKPWALQLFSGYWREDNRGDAERLQATVMADGDYRSFARLQSAQFYQTWQRARADR